MILSSFSYAILISSSLRYIAAFTESSTFSNANFPISLISFNAASIAKDGVFIILLSRCISNESSSETSSSLSFTTMHEALTNKLASGNIIIVLITLKIVWNIEILTLSIDDDASAVFNLNTTNPTVPKIITPKTLNSKLITAALFEFLDAPILESNAV